MEKKKRIKNIFPHAALRKYMLGFGAEGFRGDVFKYTEKILYEFLKEVTEYAVKFTKHDGRVRLNSDDLKQSLLYLYKNLFDKMK